MFFVTKFLMQIIQKGKKNILKGNESTNYFLRTKILMYKNLFFLDFMNENVNFFYLMKFNNTLWVIEM